MSELTLESLARRLEEVERRLNEKEASSDKDWRMAQVCLPVESFRKSSMKKAEKYAKRIGKRHARSSAIDPSGHRSFDRSQIHR